MTAQHAKFPALALVRWRAFRTETGECHLVGYRLASYGGCVSPAVREFDPDSMRAATESGEVYELHGPPGFDEDALRVWAVWQRVNHVLSATDVTDELLAAVQERRIKAGA